MTAREFMFSRVRTGIDWTVFLSWIALVVLGIGFWFAVLTWLFI